MTVNIVYFFLKFFTPFFKQKQKKKQKIMKKRTKPKVILKKKTKKKDFFVFWDTNLRIMIQSFTKILINKEIYVYKEKKRGEMKKKSYNYNW